MLRGPRSSSFWVPGNLSHHMIRLARTGEKFKSGEITGRTKNLTLWLGGRKKILWPRCCQVSARFSATFNQDYGIQPIRLLWTTNSAIYMYKGITLGRKYTLTVRFFLCCNMLQAGCDNFLLIIML
jgi:hypothetical protein